MSRQCAVSKAEILVGNALQLLNGSCRTNNDNNNKSNKTGLMEDMKRCGGNLAAVAASISLPQASVVAVGTATTSCAQGRSSHRQW